MRNAVVVLMVNELTKEGPPMRLVCPEAKPVANVTSVAPVGIALGFQLAASLKSATSFAKAVPPPSQVKAAPRTRAEAASTLAAEQARIWKRREKRVIFFSFPGIYSESAGRHREPREDPLQTMVRESL